MLKSGGLSVEQDQTDQLNQERREELRHSEESFKLLQEEKRLLSAKQITSFNWIVNSILGLVGILETLLSLRFFLRLFGANQQNDFAQLINNLSEPFMVPFATLFVSPTSGDRVNIFDFNILIAIVVYSLLSYLAVSIIRFIFRSRF
jgi:YggT family protein